MPEQRAGRALGVLIVDDNLALAENIAEILEIVGYATAVAGSAEEALAKALAAQTEVLVTDYRLPGKNGADLVRQLHGMGLRVHAVVISAHTDDRTRDDALGAGAVFLPKPIDFALLGRFIRDGDGTA